MTAHRVWHHLLYDPEPAWETDDMENERRVLDDEARDEHVELPDFEKEATP